MTIGKILLSLAALCFVATLFFHFFVAVDVHYTDTAFKHADIVWEWIGTHRVICTVEHY